MYLSFGMYSLGLFFFYIWRYKKFAGRLRNEEKRNDSNAIYSIYTFLWQAFIAVYELVFGVFIGSDRQVNVKQTSAVWSSPSPTPWTQSWQIIKTSFKFFDVSLMIFQNLKVLMCIVSVPSFWITQMRLRSEFRAVCDKQTVICQNIQLSKQSRVSPSAGKTERLRSAASN